MESKLKLAREAPPSTEGDGTVTSKVASNTRKENGDHANARSTKDTAAQTRSSATLGKTSAARKSVLHQPTSNLVTEGRESGVLALETVDLPSRHKAHVEHHPHTEAETVVPFNTTGEELNSLSTAQSATMRSSSHSVVEERLPARKPPTKPVSLSGMEKRTEEIARRKEERKRRQKQAEEEELARKTEEEEQKVREASEAKEALMRKKREERELAKQKELDRQKQIERTRELNDKACSHYRSLQCRRCVSHWKQFVLMVRRMMSEADCYHQSNVFRRHFVHWVAVFEDRVEAMLTKASDFHRIHLMKRTFHGLSEVSVCVYAHACVSVLCVCVCMCVHVCLCVCSSIVCLFICCVSVHLLCACAFVVCLCCVSVLLLCVCVPYACVWLCGNVAGTHGREQGIH